MPGFLMTTAETGPATGSARFNVDSADPVGQKTTAPASRAASGGGRQVAQRMEKRAFPAGAVLRSFDCTSNFIS